MNTDEVFAGIKVVLFGQIVAGPLVAEYLAFHGAQLIDVESKTRADIWRAYPPAKNNIAGVNRGLSFASYHANNYGMTLNLKHQRGIEIARTLVEWADVVVENFAPGTINRLGLGYEELVKVKPDIIMVSTSGQGQTGPHSAFPGKGSYMTSLCGFSHLAGQPDRPPLVLYGPYVDYICVALGAAALIAALDYKRRTGKGQYIDISLYETGIHFLAPVMLDYFVNGRVANREGNHCSYAAPHNVYPCQGEEKWCAIAVFNDEEWQAFCQAMGNPMWTKESRFFTLTGRKQNEEELDRFIGEWTRNFTAEEVMEKLQAAGVRAGVVRDCGEIFSDPHLREYMWHQKLTHPEIGEHTYQTPSYKLSRTPYQLKTPGHCLGEHTEYICKNLLCMSDQEYQELKGMGVFQ